MFIVLELTSQSEASGQQMTQSLLFVNHWPCYLQYFFYSDEFLTNLFNIPPLAFLGRNKKGIRALFPGLQKGTCWTKAIALGEISARLDCGC